MKKPPTFTAKSHLVVLKVNNVQSTGKKSSLGEARKFQVGIRDPPSFCRSRRIKGALFCHRVDIPNWGNHQDQSVHVAFLSFFCSKQEEEQRHYCYV